MIPVSGRSGQLAPETPRRAPEALLLGRAVGGRAHPVRRITGIPARNHPAPAPRPLNSRLDSTSLLETFGLARLGWRQILAPEMGPVSADLKEIQA